MSNTYSFSSLFWRLLTRVYGQLNGDALVGDMQEEYAKRQQSNGLSALAWLVSQYARSLVSGLYQQCTTPLGISRIMLLTAVLGIPLVVGLIAWLSNMDETTPELWQMVLAGEMHKALFVAEYWQVQPEALSRIDDLDLFINTPAMVWSVVAMTVVVLATNKKPKALGTAALLGVILMIAPYVLGIVYLDMAQLPAKKIGPIIAFTLFNILYMLPLMAWWMNRQVSKVA